MPRRHGSLAARRSKGKERLQVRPPPPGQEQRLTDSAAGNADGAEQHGDLP